MPRIAVSLSDDAMPRVRQEALSRGFGTPEDYVYNLLTEDLRRRDREQAEAVLLNRVDSGQSVVMDEDDFRRIREEAAARIAKIARTAHGQNP